MAITSYAPKVASPRIWRPDGAPALWIYMDAPGPTFAGDAGDVADLTGSAPAGIRSAGCTWADGPTGGCLDHDGSGYATTRFEAAGLAALTVEVRVLVKSGAASGGIFQWAGVPSSGDPFILIQYDGAGNVKFYVNGGYRATVPISTAAWHDVAATYDDGSGWGFYLDGVAVGSYAGPIGSLGIQLFAHDVYLGDGYPGPLACRTAGARIYPRALSPAEVARDFADPDWRLRRPRATFALPGPSLSPPGVGTAEAEGSPTLGGSATIAPGGIASAEVIGTPSASGNTTGGAGSVAPGGIGTGEVVGMPTLAPGPIIAAPGGIATGESAGIPSLSGPDTAAPPGVPSGESAGSPVLSPAPIDASPGGIATGEHVGTPSLSVPTPVYGIVGNWPRSIFPASIFPRSIFPGPASPAPPEPEPPAIAGPDWMVLDDVVARLLATHAFEEVAWGASLELLFPESSYPAAAVEYAGTAEAPISDIDFMIKDGRYTLTIAARGEDMRGRSAALQALAATARNALSGVSLAGICQPYFCRLREDGTAAATPPEARLRLVGSYRYTIEDDDSRDDSLS